MSAQNVFRLMAGYYNVTGEIMNDSLFTTLIIQQFKSDDIVKGLILFDQYLDRKREIG